MNIAIFLLCVVAELANAHGTHGLYGSYINYNAHAYAVPAYPKIHHRAPFYSHHIVPSLHQTYQTQHSQFTPSVTYHGNHANRAAYIGNLRSQPVVYLLQQEPLPQKTHYVEHEVDFSNDGSYETRYQENYDDDFHKAHDHKIVHHMDTVDVSIDSTGTSENLTEEPFIDNRGEAETLAPKKFKKVLVRRPALQKHFFDIEEYIVVKKVGSALVELDEAKSKEDSQFSRIDLEEDTDTYPRSKDLNYGEFEITSDRNMKPTKDKQEAIKSINSSATSSIATDNRLSLDEFIEGTFSTTLTPEVQPATPKSIVIESESSINSQQTPQESVDFDNSSHESSGVKTATSSVDKSQHETVNQLLNDYIDQKRARDRFLEQNLKESQYNQPGSKANQVFISKMQTPAEAQLNQENYIRLLTEQSNVAEIGNIGQSEQNSFNNKQVDVDRVRGRIISASTFGKDSESRHVKTRRVVISRPIETVEEVEEEVKDPVVKDHSM